MENNDNPAEIANIRELFIDPSKFQDLIGKGMSTYLKCKLLNFLFFFMS